MLKCMLGKRNVQQMQASPWLPQATRYNPCCACMLRSVIPSSASVKCLCGRFRAMRLLHCEQYVCSSVMSLDVCGFVAAAAAQSAHMVLMQACIDSAEAMQVHRLLKECTIPGDDLHVLPCEAECLHTAFVALRQLTQGQFHNVGAFCIHANASSMMHSPYLVQLRYHFCPGACGDCGRG